MNKETLATGCFNCFIWFIIITFCIAWWAVVIRLITMLISYGC